LQKVERIRVSARPVPNVTASDDTEQLPSPFVGGPYLRAAIPRALDSAAPELNLSVFIREWEVMLDPVSAQGVRSSTGVLGDSARILRQLAQGTTGSATAAA
jgi:hypothetical protein